MLEAMDAELFNIKKLITCPICLDVLSLPTSTPCEHVFCKDCLQEALTHRTMCPLCGQKVGKKQIKEQTHLTHIFQLFGELVQAVEAEKEVEQMQAPVPSNPFAAATAGTEAPMVGPPISSEPVVTLHSLERSRSLEEVVFPVGSLVNVLPRTWAGMNKLGGVGWVEAEAADDEYGWLYAVKYVLDGKRDDDVPAAFVERYQELGRQSRRSSPVERSNERASKQPRRFSASDVHSSSSSGGLRAVGDGKENDPLPAASSSNSNAKNRKIVIITTGIESKYNIDQKLEQFVTMTDNVSLSCGFTDTVSHLVVSTDKNNLMKQRTMKYMQALAKGIWIVSTRWLEDSIAAGQVLNESAYEVRGNIKAIVEQAPHRARRNKHKVSYPMRSMLVLICCAEGQCIAVRVQCAAVWGLPAAWPCKI